MKRISIFILMTLLLKTSISQTSSSITGGFTTYLNKPFEYELQNKPLLFDRVVKDYKRTFGYSLGYSFNWKFKDNFSIDISPNFNISKENFNLINSQITGVNDSGYYIFSGKIVVQKANAASLGLFIPLSLKINIYKTKLFLKGGTNFSFDRIISIVPQPFDTDGARDHFYNRRYWDTDGGKYKNIPYNNRLGFGTQIGLEYNFSKLGLTCDFVTTRLNDNPFNSINSGVKYKISSR